MPDATRPWPSRAVQGVAPNEVGPASVEYLVRAARVTDIERLVVLSDGGLDRRESPLDAAGLLRQMVYMPQASIFVAEARREVVGGAVLSLRPSVGAGGYVGTLDLLVIDAEHDIDRVTDALLEEVVKSAINKGCTRVEAVLPNDPAAQARLERQGFTVASSITQLSVGAAGADARRPR